MKRSLYSKSFALALFSFIGFFAFAEGIKQPSSVSNPFVLLLVIVAVVLAIVIGFMAKVVIGAAGIFLEKAKDDEKKTTNAATKAAVIAAVLSLAGTHVFAQAATDGTAAKASGVVVANVDDTAYYMLGGVVFTELLLIVVLLYMLRVFVGVKKKAIIVKTANEKSTVAESIAEKPVLSWWDRVNKLKPIHEEVSIDLGHNYDGIRELDNRLPPWWLYGFYITIIFACGYLYMHHVSHSLPSNLEQYQAQVVEGEAQKEAYLKKSANNVDETSVKLLTDEASITAGKTTFQANCFACHGKLGEGGVGPNLTDDYWLHGSSVGEVFKTIKYGWPDKGMKSWKDDFSPVQIAQLASFIKSLHGSNPPNSKAPQGTLVAGDAGTKNTSDSIKVAEKKS